MKFNSIHKFDNAEDASVFVDTITRNGFHFLQYFKDGGIVYTNGTHRMKVYVGN